MSMTEHGADLTRFVAEPTPIFTNIKSLEELHWERSGYGVMRCLHGSDICGYTLGDGEVDVYGEDITHHGVQLNGDPLPEEQAKHLLERWLTGFFK